MRALLPVLCAEKLVKPTIAMNLTAFKPPSAVPAVATAAGGGGAAAADGKAASGRGQKRARDEPAAAAGQPESKRARKAR